MNNMKKVSVVVPCYNAAEYLDQCLRQLLCQTIGIEDMEIILVDDASTDGGRRNGSFRNMSVVFRRRYWPFFWKKTEGRAGHGMSA